MKVLLDSGASVSVMSTTIFPTDTQDLTNSSLVHGIGGSCKAKESLICTLVLENGWTCQHPIRPTEIPHNPNLVILGRDFLQRFGNTEFDWENQTVRLGDH